MRRKMVRTGSCTKVKLGRIEVTVARVLAFLHRWAVGGVGWKDDRRK